MAAMKTSTRVLLALLAVVLLGACPAAAAQNRASTPALEYRA
jgi:hypothetical protein